MAVQRKSQIPKAPQRSLVDSIASLPEAVSELVTQPAAAPSSSSGVAPAVNIPPSDYAPFSPLTAQPAGPAPKSLLQAPVRRQRKPVRIVYTSKMDPELKDWASSFKPDEDFLEVVEQALWILRLGRSGNMPEAIAALEQASRPAED